MLNLKQNSHVVAVQLAILLLMVLPLARTQNSTEDEWELEEYFKNVGTLENPEESGKYLEGDIITDDDDDDIERNGLINSKARWPGGVVPYVIEGKFNKNEMKIITHALNEYHTKTCVRFRKRTNQKDYVAITNEPLGCAAIVGRKGGRQVVNLEAPRCFVNYGTTMHELMHALGFYHEQNRYERDDYVRVLSENVKSNMMINFRKLPARTATSYGVPYDYASVMHYKTNSFSKNGQPTLKAIKTNSPDAGKMGQRKGFSPGDVAKVRQMYKC